ncbi:MAG: pirin family protein [Candidatus Paceibacteria bacterium]
MLHRREKRGHSDHGWLSTDYSFSFGDWYDPSRMGFGALRVLNDDRIAPASGFPMHGHRDMEIITIVLQGTLTHKDSLGNTGVVHAGDVQVMSAGSGIVHAEYNESPDEPLSLFQIWIQTKEDGIAPRYDQKSFADLRVEDGIVPLVGPAGGKSPLSIHQDASISRVIVDPAHPREYQLQGEGNGVYFFIVSGTAEIAGEQLRERDALGVSAAESISIASDSRADVLCIEIPMATRE